MRSCETFGVVHSLRQWITLQTIAVVVLIAFCWQAAAQAVQGDTPPPKPPEEVTAPPRLLEKSATPPKPIEKATVPPKPIKEASTEKKLVRDEAIKSDPRVTPAQYVEGGIETVVEECGDACISGDACIHCAPCPPSKLWARAEYLLWWSDGFSTPPLVTTSVDGTARAVAGVLGEPGTTILAGDSGFAGNANSGWRITVGLLPDCDELVGFQVGYYGFGHSSTHQGFSNTDYSILARPFYNIEPGSEGQDAELVTFPAFLEGRVDVDGTTTLRGVEVLMRSSLYEACGNRLDVLAGWRFNQLEDELMISDNKTVLDSATGLVVGTVLEEFDRFETRNTFNGADIGVVLARQHCRWTFEALLKLALGNNRTDVTIDGQTVVTVPVAGADPDVAVTPAGLLAQQTNIGDYQRDVFAMIPELGLTIGYYLTPRLHATVGYTFLYFSNVVRPGEVIDTELNLSQLDGALNGAPHPLFTWQSTDAWAQGVSFGLDYRF